MCNTSCRIAIKTTLKKQASTVVVALNGRWDVSASLDVHTCSDFHLSIFQSVHQSRFSHSVKHQPRASLLTILLNSYPQSSSWPPPVGLEEPWSGFHKPHWTHTHTETYIVAKTEALINRVRVVKWAKQRRTFLENELLFKWGPFLSPPPATLYIYLWSFCLYSSCNCVTSCRSLLSDIIWFCGATLSP